jgi:CRP/FNR family cyclic AMP-dependent transcriptional regulator
MGKYIDFLRGSELFNNLFQTQLEMIESICHECRYHEEDWIFEEFSRGSELYLILEGEVEIIVSLKNGASNKSKDQSFQVIASLQRGQSFGEMALVDRGLRSAGAKACKKNTVLLCIPRDEIMMLCDAYPDLGYQVMHNLAVDLAQKIRSSNATNLSP